MIAALLMAAQFVAISPTVQIDVEGILAKGNQRSYWMLATPPNGIVLSQMEFDCSTGRAAYVGGLVVKDGLMLKAFTADDAPPAKFVQPEQKLRRLMAC